MSDRANNRIQIFNANGKFVRQWTHLGATQGMYVTPKDEMWIITHRDNSKNITYDTLAGRIMRIDIATGKILGAMESPGHEITVNPAGEIYMGARQKSGQTALGGLPSNGAALPEVLETAAEDAATERDDSVGAKHRPVHSGPFEPGGDGEFATGFDYAGGGA